MIAKQARDRFSLSVNNRFFYGWLMLAVAALGIFASGPGQSHIFSVFITSISEDLGLSHTSIASAYAFASLVAAFGLPYVGRLIDRYGVRRVVTSVAFLLGLSAIGFGTVTNVVGLALGFAALRFLGQGSLMMSSNNLGSQWFSRKRGLALSLIALGWALTVAVHPKLAQWLLEQAGWRGAWFWLGIMTWVMLLPMFFLLIQNKPEDIGLRPDGDTTSPAGGVDVDANTGLTLRQAMRTPAFWIIAFGLSVLALVVTAMFFYQVSIFEAQGATANVATTMFFVSAVTMVVSMPLLGWLLDRLPTPLMFAGAQLINVGALLALAFVSSNYASAVVYGLVFGVANAAIHTHIGYMWPRYFGRKHLGSVQGMGQTINVVGASLGPLPLGIAYDVYGSYMGMLIALAALPLIAAILTLFLRAPDLRATR